MKTSEYRALHTWIERRLGKPSKCQRCPRANLKGHDIHWANISGLYRKVAADWFRLCGKCHLKFDIEKRGISVHENASALGKLGGVARAKKLSKKRRREIARMGGNARKVAQQSGRSLSPSDA